MNWIWPYSVPSADNEELPKSLNEISFNRSACYFLRIFNSQWPMYMMVSGNKSALRMRVRLVWIVSSIPQRLLIYSHYMNVVRINWPWIKYNLLLSFYRISKILNFIPCLSIFSVHEEKDYQIYNFQAFVKPVWTPFTTSGSHGKSAKISICINNCLMVWIQHCIFVTYNLFLVRCSQKIRY